MASRIKLWLISSIVLYVLKLQLVFGHETQVPCYFIFGDSLVDNGNNNNRLPPTMTGNHLPYGVDFKHGATGRCTNGRNRVDVITQLLGFEDFIPPHATTRGDAILKGVNYGSGGSGILDATGFNVVISFNKQLRNHQEIASRINSMQGDKQYLNKCLYTVGIGSNDYINNYLRPELYPTSRVFTPEKFAEYLLKKYKKQLQTLYNTGARKVAIFTMGKVGCTPFQIERYGKGKTCAENTNNLVQMFDDQLKPLVQELNSELPDAKFTFINMTSINEGVFKAAGIEVTDKPCCKISKLSGLCEFGRGICKDRSKYAFFDFYHPTDLANEWTAKKTYKATSPNDVYPVDIYTLVKS